MAKARILGKSWLDDVTISLSGSPQPTSAIALTNVQNTDVRKVWRSSTADSHIMTADFGEAKTCNGIHLENINLRDAATIQLELSNDSGFATSPELLNVSFSPWPQEYTFRAATKFFTEVSARYFRLTITDGGSPQNPDGYLEIGRIKIGDFLEAEYGPSFGASLGYDELGELVRTRSGGLYSEQRTPARVVSMNWDFLTDPEAYELAELLRVTGHRDDVVVSLYPEAGGNLERLHTVLGRLTSVSPLERYIVAGSSGGSPQRRSRASIVVTQSL